MATAAKALAMDSRAERALFLRISQGGTRSVRWLLAVTTRLCSALELNKQHGKRMELNTTAASLLKFYLTKDFYSGNYQGLAYCESALGFWAAPLPAVSPYFLYCSRLNLNPNGNS